MHEAKKKVDKELERQFVELTNETIDKFYSHDVALYERPSPGMYDLLKMKDKNGKRVASFSSDRMGDDPSRVDAHHNENGFKEYLFNTTFVDGYHGGADSGPGHPPGDTPYYRTPRPYDRKRKKDGVIVHYSGYYRWGDEAYYEGNGESPDQLISAGLDKINEDSISLFDEAVDEFMFHIFD